jgi:hypothetical protein
MRGVVPTIAGRVYTTPRSVYLYCLQEKRLRELTIVGSMQTTKNIPIFTHLKLKNQWWTGLS